MIYKTFNIFVIFLLNALLIIFSISCSGVDKGDNSNKSEIPTISSTIWTEAMEMFTEYQIPAEGKPVKFIIHLTKLIDFAPVRSGKVELNFEGNNITPSFQMKSDKLLREGIFTPIVTFKTSGKYRTTLTYKGEGLDESFELGVIEVVKHYSDLSYSEEGENGAEISFLKEQQWKIEFHTEMAKKLIVKPSISSIAEVIPRLQGYVEVTSPVDGVLVPSVNKYMAAPGSNVKYGDVIALLAPPAGSGESWQKINLALKQAKDRFERAEHLLNKGAISKREYEDLQRQYLLLKSGFPDSSKSTSRYFSITAPISGMIKDISVVLGRHLKKGDMILNIIDSSKVWLKVNVFEDDYSKLGKSSGGSIQLPAKGNDLHLSSDQMVLLSKGDFLDNMTKTIPLIFEIANPNRVLKIGQVLQVKIYTDKENEALCVPLNSVYEDEGEIVVFVQTGGESFEKRAITTGTTFNGYIEVISGLKYGEHIVTRGIYFVKLASMSTPIGHGHAH